MAWQVWAYFGVGIALLIGLIIIWVKAFKEIKKAEVKMNTEPSLWDDVKAEFHTLVLTLFYKAKSATFWITVILIFVGLQQGGLNGMLMAVLSALGYTGKEAYQNVRFGKMKAIKEALSNGESFPYTPQAPVVPKDAPVIIEPANTAYNTEKPQVLKPAIAWKPVPNTMPEFTDLDRELMTEELMSAISEVYTKLVTHKPSMPTIQPPGEDILPYAWDKAMEQRTNQAAGIIAEEGWDKVFTAIELNNLTKLRGRNCDWRLWDRINDHWRIVYNRWFDYGMALWLYYDRQINKPPVPRPQPEW